MKCGGARPGFQLTATGHEGTVIRSQPAPRGGGWLRAIGKRDSFDDGDVPRRWL
jgi:hypothetical protein